MCGGLQGPINCLFCCWFTPHLVLHASDNTEMRFSSSTSLEDGGVIDWMHWDAVCITSGSVFSCFCDLALCRVGGIIEAW